jgi:2-hydroxychromene-2-carboxylate isomerase
MSTPIDFWFDFSSPYSCIANECIDAVAAGHGRALNRHAIVLGATFRAAESKSPASCPIERWLATGPF